MSYHYVNKLDTAAKVTRYNAIESPQWKNLHLSYFQLPPYAYLPKGSQELTGIDIDMWHLLSDHFNQNVNFIRAKSFNALATNVNKIPVVENLQLLQILLFTSW